jgi:hypothetical protein
LAANQTDRKHSILKADQEVDNEEVGSMNDEEINKIIAHNDCETENFQDMTSSVSVAIRTLGNCLDIMVHLLNHSFGFLNCQSATTMINPLM